MKHILCDKNVRIVNREAFNNIMVLIIQVIVSCVDFLHVHQSRLCWVQRMTKSSSLLFQYSDLLRSKFETLAGSSCFQALWKFISMNQFPMQKVTTSISTMPLSYLKSLLQPLMSFLNFLVRSCFLPQLPFKFGSHRSVFNPEFGHHCVIFYDWSGVQSDTNASRVLPHWPSCSLIAAVFGLQDTPQVALDN